MLALALPATPRVASPLGGVVGVSVAQVLDELLGRLAGRRRPSGTTWKASAVRSSDAPIGATASTSRTCADRVADGSLLGDTSSSADRAGQVGDDEQRAVRARAELLGLHVVGPVAGRVRRLGRAVGQAEAHREGGAAMTSSAATPSPRTVHARVVLIGRSRSVIASSCRTLARGQPLALAATQDAHADQREERRGQGDGDQDRDEDGRRAPTVPIRPRKGRR